MRTSALAAMVAALALACVASAQERGAKAGARRGKGLALLQRMDRNQDGQLSKEEFPGSDALFDRLDRDGDGAIGEQESEGLPAVLPELVWDLVDRDELFKALDQDKDGNVTAEELKAAPLGEILTRAQALGKAKLGAALGGGKGALLGRFDRDGDGKISREEFPQAKIAAFDKLDRNGDGVLDEAELARVKGGKGGKPGGGGKAGIIGRFDTNGDGKLTRDEFPQQKLAAFDRLDRNGDGVIEQAELKGVKGKGRKEKKPRKNAPAEF